MFLSQLTIPPAKTLNGSVSSADARQLSLAGSYNVAQLVYGEDRIGGRLLNVLLTGANSSTLLVQVLWGYACDSINDIRLNDLALPAGSSTTNYIGTQTGTDAALVAAFSAQGITYTSTLSGYAYSVISMPVRSFDGRLQITARIRGRRVYDPRLDSTNGGTGAHRLADANTWAWSDNPALAEADFLNSTTYGAGVTLDWATVIATANVCDALIGSPSEKRRLIGISFTEPKPVADIAQVLAAHAGCWLVQGTAGVRLVADADASSVADILHANGDIRSIDAIHLRDASTQPTEIEVIYTDTSKLPWRDGSAIATLAGATQRRISQVRMPGVQRYSQAIREATERLNKLTLGTFSTAVELFDQGARFEVGDIVRVTHPVGFTLVPCRVAGPPILRSAGRWLLPLVKHDPAVYSTLVQSAPSIPDTSLLNPAGPPPDVTGMAATAIPGAIRITWPQKPVADVDVMEIRRGASWAAGVRLESGVAGSTEVDGTTYDWLWPASGSYTLLFRWRDRDGNLSVNAASLAITVTATGIGIGASQFSGTVGGGNLLFNSSFEVDGNLDGLADGWNSDSAGATGAITYSRVPGMRGTTAQRIDCAALGTTSSDWAGQWQRFRVDNLGGSPLAVSAWALGTSGIQAVILARFYSDVGATTIVGSDITSSTTAPTGAWGRLSASGIIPSGALWCYVWIRLAQRTSVGAAQLNFDDAQAEIANVPTAWSAAPAELATSNIGGVNLLSNGGFEWDSNADGLPDNWVAEGFGTTGTITRELIPGIGNGKALRVTASNLGTTGGDVAGVFQAVRVDGMAGQPITLSAFVLMASAGLPKVRMVVRFYSDAAATVQVGSDITTGIVPGPTSGFTRMFCSGEVPSAALWAYVFLRVTQRDGTAGLAQINFDNAMLQFSAVPTPWERRADELLAGVVGTGELAANAATQLYTSFLAGPVNNFNDL